MSIIGENGACRCRCIKFKVTGYKLFNGLCHCKSCSYNRGMSPVHLIAVTPAQGVEIIEGKEFLRKVRGDGKMRHKFCSNCGVEIYQGPKGADFRGILPTNFHIEDGVSCLLPEKYKPECHVNYENRQYDWNDDLPKFKAHPPHGRLDNHGYDKHSDTFY